MTSDRRPGIFQIGQVHDDGTTITVSGWGLSWCVARCTCHQVAPDGGLRILEGHGGSLGLATLRPECDCCAPWTADELAAIPTDLAAIQAAPEVSR
jgi:hypothetical protein